MEKISLLFLYRLGANLNPLTQFKPEAKNRIDMILACYSCQTMINSLFELFPTLTVCSACGKELLNSFESRLKWWRETPSDKLKESDFLTDAEFQGVVNKAKEFETILSAELQTLATYQVTQKGIYSTVDLIERAESILPATVLERIEPKVVEKIRQSGRCLAFDNATASAFHMLRATEAVMHDYYIAVCKPQPKPKEMLSSWGAYISELQKSPKPDVKEVVAMLQQIKDRHRNLIMHPEVVLTPDEAFTLFEIAQGAIMAMADKLPARAKNKKGK